MPWFHGIAWDLRQRSLLLPALPGFTRVLVPCQTARFIQDRVTIHTPLRFGDKRLHGRIKIMAKLSREIIVAAIEGFESQKRRIDEQIAELRALGNGHTPSAETPKKRGMSAAGRKAIAEAQRKRWAETESKSPKVKRAQKKRILSAAGKAAIVAALRKRWAAKKAEAKKAAK